MRLLRTLIAVAALATALAGCSSNSNSSQGAKGAGALKVSEVGTVIIEAAGRTARVKAEVVRSFEDQRKGLMHRKALCASCGMLFIYPRQENHTFWMKNTFIALDMIFVSDEKRVVGAVENAEPLSEESLSVDKPSRFILEVNGGFVKKHGVKVGAMVRWEGITGK